MASQRLPGGDGESGAAALAAKPGQGRTRLR